MAFTNRRDMDLKRKYAAKKATAKDPLEIIKAHCACNGIDGVKTLTRAFHKWDKDGSGTLDFKEFRKVLNKSGITLDERLVKKAFDVLDTDGDNVVTLEEAKTGLVPQLSRHRKYMIFEVFRKLDKDRSGFVTPDDLSGVYNYKKHPKYLNGEWSAERVMNEFLKTFDTGTKDDKISEVEFIDYYCALSASIDNDAYFDLIMRQAWGL